MDSSFPGERAAAGCDVGQGMEYQVPSERWKSHTMPSRSVSSMRQPQPSSQSRAAETARRAVDSRG
ncbi:hypothetical protein AMK31_37765 [Streptomyces sp. TSRI0107]|nr:hypothetical protein AMK31_37765 [Streptomyces sp. TSRI0107]